MTNRNCSGNPCSRQKRGFYIASFSDLWGDTKIQGYPSWPVTPPIQKLSVKTKEHHITLKTMQFYASPLWYDLLFWDQYYGQC